MARWRFSASSAVRLSGRGNPTSTRPNSIPSKTLPSRVHHHSVAAQEKRNEVLHACHSHQLDFRRPHRRYPGERWHKRFGCNVTTGAAGCRSALTAVTAAGTWRANEQPAKSTHALRRFRPTQIGASGAVSEGRRGSLIPSPISAGVDMCRAAALPKSSVAGRKNCNGASTSSATSTTIGGLGKFVSPVAEDRAAGGKLLAAR